MRGPEHYGREPAQGRWTADCQVLYFRWAAAESAWDAPMSTYRVRPVGGSQPELVSDAHTDSIAPYTTSGPLTRDGRTRVVSANGDLWLIDTRRGSARRLTETVADESDPRFSSDERSRWGAQRFGVMCVARRRGGPAAATAPTCRRALRVGECIAGDAVSHCTHHGEWYRCTCSDRAERRDGERLHRRHFRTL